VKKPRRRSDRDLSGIFNFSYLPHCALRGQLSPRNAQPEISANFSPSALVIRFAAKLLKVGVDHCPVVACFCWACSFLRIKQ
jgi:hypothetical protein